MISATPFPYAHCQKLKGLWQRRQYKLTWRYRLYKKKVVEVVDLSFLICFRSFPFCPSKNGFCHSLFVPSSWRLPFSWILRKSKFLFSKVFFFIILRMVHESHHGKDPSVLDMVSLNDNNTLTTLVSSPL